MYGLKPVLSAGARCWQGLKPDTHFMNAFGPAEAVPLLQSSS
jgi:hypothetical protein